MNGNIEFLNYIYQNSEMGKDTMKQLIGISEDEEFNKMLHNQYEGYKNINDKTTKILDEHSKEPKEINPLSKASTYVSINMKTLTNKSPSHISEMLIQGSTMGIIDITKKIKEYPDANGEIVNLAHNLLEFEQKNLEECKQYL